MARARRRQRVAWAAHRAVERPVARFPAHGRTTLALAYANTYHVGMSSLAFQRLYRLVAETPGWAVERFFADGAGMPRSVELESPLAAFGAVAFSISFEEDYVHLVEMLARAGIPPRRTARGAGAPLVIAGGSATMINPLPLAPFVDVFALGAAENLLPELLPALAESARPDEALERLAGRPGFFVPARHLRDDGRGAAATQVAKLELSEDQMRRPGHLPTTAIVTPKTEFADKYLIEMSRGCPEKCRYCWATFGMGRFRWHPTEFILGALNEARGVTDRLGFVATAVGDHPDIERILTAATDQGFRTSVSSIRIPAVSPGALAALAASGERSITLAPETGSDRLRRALNKPVPNELLLEKVRLIFRHGFTRLKLYFIVGLPGETAADVEAIVDLARACRRLMLEELAPAGVIGHIHLGANFLVPKPYTGYQRQGMEAPALLEERNARLERGVAALPNVSLATMPLRQAVWQGYLSKAGVEAATAIERVAAGESLGSVLRRFADAIESEVFERPVPGRRLRWQFLRAG